MTQNDVYKTIRSLNSCPRIYDEDIFYSIDENHILKFIYSCTSDSQISFVCPKDDNGDFILIEIKESETTFTKITEGGSVYNELDLSTEDSFFQLSTIMDLGFTFDELIEIRMSFLKYYNGFLNEITIFI